MSRLVRQHAVATLAAPLVAASAALAAPLHAQGADTTARVAPPSGAFVTMTARRDSATDVAAAARRRRLREQRQRMPDLVTAKSIASARTRARAFARQGAHVHVAADQQTSYTLVVRTDTSQVEQHARWDDIVVVRSGRGVVSFGERADGRRMLAPGEYRGGRLVEDYQLRLGPGDIARIPAGVPHLFAPEGAEPFEYMVIKVRRPERPVDPR